MKRVGRKFQYFKEILLDYHHKSPDFTALRVLQFQLRKFFQSKKYRFFLQDFYRIEKKLIENNQGLFIHETLQLFSAIEKFYNNK